MGSPQDDQIKEWKRIYGKIFSVSVAGIDYVFREITFEEYDEVVNVQSDLDSAEAEDYLVSIALLHPKDPSFDGAPAGLVTSIAEEVLEVSGFGMPATAKKMLDTHREEVSEVRGLMKSFVLATMPAYREEELNQLTFNQLAYKVALAEQIIEVNQKAFGVDNEIRLDLIDPAEEHLRDQEAAQKHAAQKKGGQAGFNDPIAQKLRSALG